MHITPPPSIQPIESIICVRSGRTYRLWHRARSRPSTAICWSILPKQRLLVTWIHAFASSWPIYIRTCCIYISAKICTGGGLGMAVSYRIQIRRCRVLLLSSTVPKPSHSVVTRQMQKMERTYVQARRSIYSTTGLHSPLLCCMPLGSGNQYTCTLQPTGSSILVFLFYMCVIFCT